MASARYKSVHTYLERSHVCTKIFILGPVLSNICNPNLIYCTEYFILHYRGAVSPRTLATMERQSDLLSVICSSSVEGVPSPTGIARASTNLFLGLPLPLLPSPSPITHTLSSCFCLITYLMNLSCRCLRISSCYPLRQMCLCLSYMRSSLHELNTTGLELRGVIDGA